tara:strand:+ start:1022 stop:1222 length:201 start_codon:yes stop_codon:yes gene_type:complete
MKGQGAKFLGVALATIAGFYIYDNFISTSEVVSGGGEEETEETRRRFRGKRFGGNQPRGRANRLRR